MDTKVYSIIMSLCQRQLVRFMEHGFNSHSICVKGRLLKHCDDMNEAGNLSIHNLTSSSNNNWVGRISHYMIRQDLHHPSQSMVIVIQLSGNK